MRLVRILCGYGAAVGLAGALALVAGGLEVGFGSIAQSVMFFGIAALVAAVFALPIAGPVIALSEVRGIRQWTLFAGTGVVVAVVMAVALGDPATETAMLVDMLALSAIGALSGLAYWAVAGRSAGSLTSLTTKAAKAAK